VEEHGFFATNISIFGRFQMLISYLLFMALATIRSPMSHGHLTLEILSYFYHCTGNRRAVAEAKIENGGGGGRVYKIVF
jgi:hypothetical protein